MVNLKKKLLTLGIAVGISATMLMDVPAFAAIHIEQGPTKIQQGMANRPEDITIWNDDIAVSFAVGSNNYWNMTNGSILDVAMMNENGTFGVDLVNDIEFLNNLWTATGSYQGSNLLKADSVTYEFYKGAQRVTDAVQADKVIVTAKTKYWLSEHKMPLDVTIQYTLEDGKSYIGLHTVVYNPEGNDAYKNMYSGYTISTLAANMFGPFGYYPDLKITGIGIGDAVDEPYGNFVLTYGKLASQGYAVSIQMDGANAYKGSSGYKDLYTLRNIEAGQTYTYDGELLVTRKDATAPILERYFDKDTTIPKGTIAGTVNFSKQGLKNAYIIVEREGSYIDKEGKKRTTMQPFVWEIADEKGAFSFALPTGKYEVHAESKGCTPSAKIAVTVEAGAKVTENFAVLKGAQAEVTAVDENGKAIPVKIEVSGIKTDVKTLGTNVFFADPATKKVDFSIPAGTLGLTASYGKDFESQAAVLSDVAITPGEKYHYQFVIPTIVNPRKNSWYNMDNHQHSNIGDGATSVEDLFKAQIAAKLDFNLVSDHDSVANNTELAKLAKKQKRPFLPSLEVSPGWGHWGILNVDYRKKTISPNSTPAEIIKEGHAMGAVVVVNHPYSDYGFFHNREGVLGGSDNGSEDFDLIELQSTLNLAKSNNMDKRALDTAMQYWNKGVRKYLSAGSDQHDATSTLYPGIIRMYAHIDGELNSKNYLDALLHGHSYVTMGPIFTPDEHTMFGSTQTVQAQNTYTMKTKIQAVNGLKRVDVYCEGNVIYSVPYEGTKDEIDFSYDVQPKVDTWYSFVAVDEKEHYAVSNPVWIKVK